MGGAGGCDSLCFTSNIIQRHVLMLNAAVQSLTVKIFFPQCKTPSIHIQCVRVCICSRQYVGGKKNIDLLYLIVIEKGNE